MVLARLSARPQEARPSAAERNPPSLATPVHSSDLWALGPWLHTSGHFQLSRLTEGFHGRRNWAAGAILKFEELFSVARWTQAGFLDVASSSFPRKSQRERGDNTRGRIRPPGPISTPVCSPTLATVRYLGKPAKLRKTIEIIDSLAWTTGRGNTAIDSSWLALSLQVGRIARSRTGLRHTFQRTPWRLWGRRGYIFTFDFLQASPATHLLKEIEADFLAAFRPPSEGRGRVHKVSLPAKLPVRSWPTISWGVRWVHSVVLTLRIFNTRTSSKTLSLEDRRFEDSLGLQHPNVVQDVVLWRQTLWR